MKNLVFIAITRGQVTTKFLFSELNQGLKVRMGEKFALQTLGDVKQACKSIRNKSYSDSKRSKEN